MSAPGSIAGFGGALEAALGYPRGPRARRALQEIADHLEDAAAAIEAEGVPRNEAEARACARFGTAEATARRLVAGGVLAGEMPIWVAVPLWGGLALSVAAGGAFAVMATIHNGMAAGAAEAAILAATVVMALAFARLQFSAAATGRAGLVATGALSALLLIGGLALGGAATVSGIAAGDMEYYLVVRAGLLAGTGLWGAAAQFMALKRMAGAP